jgi:hypothetical protein
MEITPPALSRRRIRRISPLSAAKVLGILYACLGLVFVPFLLIFSLVAAHAPNSQKALPFFISGIFAVLAPVLYGAMGFIGGLISAAIYNVISGLVGGIEFEVE